MVNLFNAMLRPRLLGAGTRGRVLPPRGLKALTLR